MLLYSNMALQQDVHTEEMGNVVEGDVLGIGNKGGLKGCTRPSRVE